MWQMWKKEMKKQLKRFITRISKIGRKYGDQPNLEIAQSNKFKQKKRWKKQSLNVITAKEHLERKKTT